MSAPQTILVSGASGLVGSALVPFLQEHKHVVRRLVRSSKPDQPGNVYWDPERDLIDRASLSGIDTVIHLAGESIAGRWSAAKKEKILESRVRGTRLLAESLAGLAKRPRLFICASAVGIYGDRGDEPLTESAPPGKGFLAEVCTAWEDSSHLAQSAGIRTVNLRFGLILSRNGAALAKLRPIFRLGLGGVVGSGKQFMSWIWLSDVLGIVEHILSHDELKGPVNTVSPTPVTNSEFTKTLAEVLRRPAVLPVPAPAVRLLLGEFANEALLSSTRALPEKLVQSGYQFLGPSLSAVLATELPRNVE